MSNFKVHLFLTVEQKAKFGRSALFLYKEKTNINA